MPALAVWTPEDGLLGALAPLGLALAAENALVVDLDGNGPRYPGPRSLADLVEDGVRGDDLRPRGGVAVLRNGGADPHDAGRVVEALMSHHDNVVLRLPPQPEPDGLPIPVVPVRLLLPGAMFPLPPRPAVFQSTPALVRMPAEGIRLPVPSVTTVAALLTGRRPPRRDRWLTAWARAWRYRWGR
jgi:hypothetical protein